MQVVLGPDAPPLEEQSIGLFIDCTQFQAELDDLYDMVELGTITAEAAASALSGIASRISEEAEAFLDKIKSPAVIAFNESDETH